jgi:hypothetical protein
VKILPQIACVLTKDFSEEDVIRLYRGCIEHCKTQFKFICFAGKEVELPNVIEKLPLYGSEDEGDFLFLNVFRLRDVVLFLKLDTKVVGDITDIVSYDPSPPLLLAEGIGGAILFKDREHIWEEYCKHKARYQRTLVYGDRAYMTNKPPISADLAFLQEYYSGSFETHFPGRVVQFDQRQGLYPRTSIVCGASR